MPSIEEQLESGMYFTSFQGQEQTLIAIPPHDFDDAGNFAPRPNVEREYIAGPMRGYDKWNFPAFDRARNDRLMMGIQVISPADLDRARGIDENTIEFSSDDFKKAMKIDTYALLQCTGIYMLKGWSESTGAKFELMLAQQFGLTVAFEDGAESGWTVMAAEIEEAPS